MEGRVEERGVGDGGIGVRGVQSPSHGVTLRVSYQVIAISKDELERSVTGGIDPPACCACSPVPHQLPLCFQAAQGLGHRGLNGMV